MSEDLFSANCNFRVGDRIDSWHVPVELCWANVPHKIEKSVATEGREELIAWSDEFMLTYTNELYSSDFMLCVREQFLHSILTRTDQLIALHVHRMVKTIGNKKKRLDWFDHECVLMKRSVKRQLRKFRRTNIHGEREIYVKYRKEFNGI